MIIKAALVSTAIIAFSCSNNNSDRSSKAEPIRKEQKPEAVSKNQSSKLESYIKKDSVDFSLNTFKTIPNEIDGCSCYFYLSKQDERKEKYLFVNDFASTAFVSINGKVQKFELKEHAEKSKVYQYSNGTYDLKVEITKEKDGDDETSILEGLITISKGSKVIQKSFVGSCGC